MIEGIRAACAAGRLLWRKHALERMLTRGISRERVRQALLEGEVIASYPHDRPFPSVLVDKRDGPDVLHVVVALDEQEGVCHIITAYRPDTEHFEDDLKTRRRP